MVETNNVASASPYGIPAHAAYADRAGFNAIDAAHAVLETGIVSDLTHDAEGVVRTDTKVVFIAGALPGEQVTFRRRAFHR